MNAYMQQTLVKAASFTGTGLNTGKKSKITVHPAPESNGIIFRHIAKTGEYTDIPANWRHTRPMPLCTCLSSANGVLIRTVEHILAACYACGIDNAIIDVQGNEIPLLDGSAAPFVAAFEQAGIQMQGQVKKRIRILKTVRVEGVNRYLQIEPADHFSVDLKVGFTRMGEFRWNGLMEPDVFKAQMISARTFGKLSNGLLAKLFSRFSKTPVALGANLDNCVILWRGRVFNKEGLRMPDEFIRHRVLDLIGDMMLSQGYFLGKIEGFSTSHQFNQQLLKNLFSDETAWCWVDD